MKNITPDTDTALALLRECEAYLNRGIMHGEGTLSARVADYVNSIDDEITRQEDETIEEACLELAKL